MGLKINNRSSYFSSKYGIHATVESPNNGHNGT